MLKIEQTFNWVIEILNRECLLRTAHLTSRLCALSKIRREKDLLVHMQQIFFCLKMR